MLDTVKWSINKDQACNSVMDEKLKDTATCSDVDQGIPWHHIQLYKLYGDEADYFLHPKLLVEKHSSTKPLSRRALNSSKHAHVGAKSLWLKLRSDSTCKLHAIDMAFPYELKSTYQSFVREFVSSQDNRDKSCMYTTKDVPEIDRLMDYSRQKKTKERQHKTQIMWRASRKNEDSAAILLHNNPLPDLNDCKGEDSVLRYLPRTLPALETSVLEALPQSHELADENNFIAKDNGETLKTRKCRENISNAISTNICREKSVSQKNESAPQFKCIFLTEEDASTSELSFHKKELPKVEDAKLLNSTSLPVRRRDSCHIAPVIGTHKPLTRAGIEQNILQRTSSVPRVSEPLTLAALLDYKRPLATSGSSPFAFSRTPMWTVT